MDLKADLESSKDLRDLLSDRSNSPFFLTRTQNESVPLNPNTKVTSWSQSVCHTRFNGSRTFRRGSLCAARTTADAMVVVRLPDTGYRGCKGVVKSLGPSADGRVARRGAPPNVRAYIAFSTTLNNDFYCKYDSDSCRNRPKKEI
jgi:hypothetical protein